MTLALIVFLALLLFWGLGAYERGPQASALRACATPRGGCPGSGTALRRGG